MSWWIISVRSLPDRLRQAGFAKNMTKKSPLVSVLPLDMFKSIFLVSRFPMSLFFITSTDIWRL
jgi:hypothetical protein